MITIIKAEASWNAERDTWRVHVRFVGPAGEKRTYIALPLRNERRDAKEAKARAAAFSKKLDPLYHEWAAKFQPKASPIDPATTEAAPVPAKAKKRHKNGEGPLTLDWLLSTCLQHDEVWGKVARPQNYQSSVKKVSAVAGDAMVSDFEPANGGRATVMKILEGLRETGIVEGTTRKLMGILRQALHAAIGNGISYPIVHPQTGESILSDVPAFPRISKSPPREKIIDGNEERTIFSILRAKEAAASEEEAAFAAKLAHIEDEALRARRQGGWNRSPRFSSQQWRWYRRFVLLLIETGMRRGEGLYCGPHTLATIDRLDDDDDVIETIDVITLPALVTKTSAPRDINISQTVADMIDELNAEAQPVTMIFKRQPIEIEKAWCLSRTIRQAICG